ncbi:GerMN domain-containing protein [Treponema sp. UBA3813]|uniref:GerMN domain-containing protein n=1 Tax=Treponema sp. UBA3813 TaxID=1947715 RepID=UPI0025F2EE4F|nr:GerMN domain-containing protein [Treponema sp. UBA3813]
MSEKGKNNKKKTGLGLAIWILLILIILIVFLVKQEEIKENFDKSGATALIEKKIGKEIFDDKKDSKKSEDSGEIIIDLTKNSKKTEPVAKTDTPAKKEITEAKSESKSENTVDSSKKDSNLKKEQESTETKKDKPSANTINAEKKPVVTAKSSPSVTSAEKTVTKTVTSAPANTTKSKICFVALDSDGLVVRKEVSRSVAKDSPLAEALKELLKGPSATEAKTGCQSYIPEGSKLLGISIKDGIATLNFNEEFQFNNYGPVGSNVQLMQVVYTATSFSTVKKVQFLIEGKKLDYLSEGVWVGSPRGRNDY